MINSWKAPLGVISVALLATFSANLPLSAHPIPSLLIAQNLETSWNILDRQVDIRLSPDGQMGIAIITEVIEFTTEDGAIFLSESIDTLRFGLVNGQPMVVSANLEGWLASTPSSSSGSN